MNTDPDPKEILRRKFPEMKQLSSSPSLFSINGFGLRMAGKRGFDAETGTYVKSHIISALYIPIFTLGSYRVADADNGGWYFLGKVGTSTFAKFWNLLAIALITSTIGLSVWKSHTNSPDYLAKEQMAQAREQSEAGDLLQAATTYRDLIHDNLPLKEDAKVELKKVLISAMDSDSVETIAATLKFAADLPNYQMGVKDFVPELATLASGAVTRFSETQPAEALRILDIAGTLPTPAEDLNGARKKLLITLTSTKPENAQYASDLAEIFEAENKIDEAFALLQPHAENLGTSEGSRILGQILLVRGEALQATQMLDTYIKPRLTKWRKAEKSYNKLIENTYEEILEDLQEDKGPKSFYLKYQKAKSDQEKAEIVDTHIYGKMRKMPKYQRAGRQYETAAKIIPVIMDLGLSELRVAQSTTDPQQRAAYLKKAEEHFLLLESSSGESSEFKFFLGQVYFWSGRQDEGRKLFEEILTNSNRDVQTLLTLSRTLRETGDITEARQLAEEAFKKGANNEQKNEAAGLRALMFNDLDDQIIWLEKITTDDLNITTRLAAARASKAMTDGHTKKAIAQLKIAEEGWSKLPTSSSTLNNGALVQFDLFSLTGKLAYQEKGSELMERAVNLESNNSIVLQNAASSLATTAVMQLLDGKIHPRLVQEGIGLSSLRFFYHDQISREKLLTPLKENPSFAKSLALLDRALLLSPNNQDLYTTAIAYHSYLKNGAQLQKIINQLKLAKLDHTESQKNLTEHLAGGNDAEIRKARMLSYERSNDILAELKEDIPRRRMQLILAENRLASYSLGDSVNYEKEIPLLREIAKRAPSTRATNVLIQALSQKACTQLAASNPKFQKTLESSRRYLDAKVLLILSLTSETLRPQVLANSVAQEALTAYLKQDRGFPSSCDSTRVIVTQYLAPSEFAEAKSQFEQNRFITFSEEIASFTSPWSPNTMITKYLNLTCLGKTARATAWLEKIQQIGLVFPN